MKTSIQLIVEELTHSELKERFLELHTNYEKIKDELFELKQPCVINRRELLIDFVRYMNTNTIMAQYEWINAPVYVDEYLKSNNSL
jgi:hypothetical protein